MLRKNIYQNIFFNKFSKLFLGRNIFHAAVSMCQPTSNKDSDQDVYSSQNSGSSFASSFDIEPSLTSRAMNLRDMMRRAAASTQRYSCNKITKTWSQISHQDWNGFFSNIRHQRMIQLTPTVFRSKTKPCKKLEIDFKSKTTHLSNFDKWWSDAHFESFLFYYYCIKI